LTVAKDIVLFGAVNNVTGDHIASLEGRYPPDTLSTQISITLLMFGACIVCVIMENGTLGLWQEDSHFIAALDMRLGSDKDWIRTFVLWRFENMVTYQVMEVLATFPEGNGCDVVMLWCVRGCARSANFHSCH
jgi:hypothetical protein